MLIFCSVDEPAFGDVTETEAGGDGGAAAVRIASIGGCAGGA